MEDQLLYLFRKMSSSGGGSSSSNNREFKKKSKKMAVVKTPNPITMYNEVSESGGIHRSAAYMSKYDEMTDKKVHVLYAANLDIIHFVKDMFIPSKKYSSDEARQFLKAYNTVVNIKKHGIWNMKRLLLEVTDPSSKTSRRGWKVHYQIEQSIEELMRIEADFKQLAQGANYIVKTVHMK
jgi:hypothetical protein